jgi:hypothetical protein
MRPTAPMAPWSPTQPTQPMHPAQFTQPTQAMQPAQPTFARTWHGLVTEPRAGVRTAAGAELNRYAASRSAAAAGAATAGRSGNRREITFDTPLPAIETP